MRRKTYKKWSEVVNLNLELQHGAGDGHLELRARVGNGNFELRGEAGDKNLEVLGEAGDENLQVQIQSRSQDCTSLWLDFVIYSALNRHHREACRGPGPKN